MMMSTPVSTLTATNVSTGHPLGIHRVVNQVGVLPQAARELNPALPLCENELLIDVEALNIDAASFWQIRETLRRDVGESMAANPEAIGRVVKGIVEDRGKMQNPVTGSGGVLVGRIAQIGPKHPAYGTLSVGDRVVTLVSLSLTPLNLKEVLDVDVERHQIKVRGHAILFERTIFAPLPADFPDMLAMAIYDVCGAPAQTARLVAEGQRVLILGGGGKSGLLCVAEALRGIGPHGKIIAIEPGKAGRARLAALGQNDSRLIITDTDATNPLAVLRTVMEATGGDEVDLAINCVSVQGAEMGTILPVRDGGVAYFFSMATSFTAATLGAEGAVKDVTLIMGNGYAPGHAAHALGLVRATPALRAILEEWNSYA